MPILFRGDRQLHVWRRRCSKQYEKEVRGVRLASSMTNIYQITGLMLKEDLTGYVKIYQMLRMIFQMQLGRLNLLMISLKMKKTSIMHTMHIFMETTGLIKSSRIIKKHG